jgi:tetratricopeptide (TPR) repeat protein
LGDRNSERRILGNLANAYASIGQYSRAESYQIQSIQIARELGDQYRVATSQANLGSIYLDQGLYAEALRFYKFSLDFMGGTEDLFLPHLLINIGLIYHVGERDFNRAISCYERALQLARIGENQWLEAESLSGLAFGYESIGNYEIALKHYDSSLAIFETIQVKKAMAIALNNRAHTLLTWGQSLPQSLDVKSKYQEAEDSLREAVLILDSLRDRLSSDSDRISLFDTQAMTYNLLQQVLIEQGQGEVALEVAEKGRSRAFTTLLTERQQLRSDDISLEQIQAIARAQNATLVEYSLVPDNAFVHQGKQRGTTAELYIWVVQPDGTITFRHTPVNTQIHRLEDLVKTSRAAIGLRSRGFVIDEPETPDASGNLKTLHQLLIDPIQDLLPANPDERVIFIPQGDLFLVPFAALVDGAGHYLIERHTLLTAPSIQV